MRPWSCACHVTSSQMAEYAVSKGRVLCRDFDAIHCSCTCSQQALQAASGSGGLPCSQSLMELGCLCVCCSSVYSY